MQDTVHEGEILGDGNPKVLAFYLPQFHQVAENDAWHGEGFTEWTVVARSKPLFPGHRQPELPGELGFYDLRVPEIRYRQAQLARAHGLSGFLYYHYWFGGRRMLGRPFDEVLRSGQPDFPFALCWANESWYRRWQGSIDEMLMEQVFSEEDDIAHIRWLNRCFEDPRYIRIGGRPLLAVYRAHYLPDPRRTVDVWRSECERAGVAPPWLVMFETEEELSDPAARGFDASAEFLPHHLASLVPAKPRKFGADRSHRMFEYEDVAAAYLNRPPVDWRRFPCVATGWDNTPRRQSGEALILRGATPEAYGQWLAEAARRQKQLYGSNGVVFVNAWNEWAEGAHLEPDEYWGRRYLETTREVLGQVFDKDPPKEAESPPPDVHPEPTPAEDLYHDLYAQYVLLQKSASGFLAYADRRIKELKKHYEAKLMWAKHRGELITDLNEWLYEQLRAHDERLRKLGLSDSSEWLNDPGLRPGNVDAGSADGEGEMQLRSTSRAAGEDEEPPPSWREDSGSQSHAPSEPSTDVSAETEDEDEDAAVDADTERDSPERQREELRRDEGFDDLPTMRTPGWLLELERDAAE
jgi:hypothetical protein